MFDTEPIRSITATPPMRPSVTTRSESAHAISCGSPVTATRETSAPLDGSISTTASSSGDVTQRCPLAGSRAMLDDTAVSIGAAIGGAHAANANANATRTVRECD